MKSFRTFGAMVVVVCLGVVSFSGVPALAEDLCEATCKDGSSGSLPAIDKDDCHVNICDALCGGDKANVESCSFKGQNVKGNCEITCVGDPGNTIHIALGGVDATPIACHAECDTQCAGLDGVKGCFFKGENIKGGMCTVTCKVGPGGAAIAADKDDCHVNICDALCGGDKANVKSCFYKDQNVKGKCHVLCNNKVEAQDAFASDAECQAFCDNVCITQELDKVGICTFKSVAIEQSIPTVSEWGMAVMCLLVLTAGTVVVMRRRAMVTA